MLFYIDPMVSLASNSNKSHCLSDVAEASIMLDGKPFRLDLWPMHRAFYDGRFSRTLFKTSRQVAKSTTLANFSIIECTLIPHFSTMFVSPSKEQTVRFSTSRIQKTMRYSPRMTRFLDPDLSDRVFHKQFTNGSEMLFTYALDEAERLRGPSTDRNMYDEVQDMLYDPVITVGNETLNESDKGMFETYAGTPKTMENTIEFLWSLSTQTEWVIKCDSCGSHQYIDSERSIGKEGPVCVKCQAYLNTFTGQWIDLNPRKFEPDELDTQLKGFHISQLMMPSNSPLAMKPFGEELVFNARKRWARIKTKFEELPPSTFKNEVLGVSDAQGTRLITLAELEALCTGPALSDIPSKNMEGITQTVAGVDWSGGGNRGMSRTVLWVWGWSTAVQKLICMSYKVYSGLNPVDAVRDIAETCSHYRVGMVVGDAGEGALANDELRKALGHHRVTQVQYGAQKHQLQWNGVDRYMGDRTSLIDNYFMLLKRQGVMFGPVAQMKVAIDEILNEFEEVTTTGRKVWRHSPQKPDDCLHAGLFGWVAWRAMHGDT